MTSELQGARRPGEPLLGGFAATRRERPAGTAGPRPSEHLPSQRTATHCCLPRFAIGLRIRRSARSNDACRHVADVICTRVRVIPTVVAQHGGPATAVTAHLKRDATAGDGGGAILAWRRWAFRPSAISRMPRTKRSARRRSRAARRAAARPNWAIRGSSRAAHRRPYRTDTSSRNARRMRRMGLRHRPASRDAVPGAVRSTSASTRRRRTGGVREATASDRSQSLRSPRSRAGALRTRGRRRT